MSRRWMYGDHTTAEYLSGVGEFIRCALANQQSTKAEKIYCPCCDCNNVRRLADIDEIEDHLFRRGFKQDYHVWFWHGEKIPDRPSSSVNEFDLQVDSDESDDNISENYEMDDDDDDEQEDEMNEMMDGVRDRLDERPKVLEQLTKAAETPFPSFCSTFMMIRVIQGKNIFTMVWQNDFEISRVSWCVDGSLKKKRCRRHSHPRCLGKSMTTSQRKIGTHLFNNTSCQSHCEKARNSASFNKSHHRTGQKGYIRKRHEWIDDGRLPPEAALTFSSSSSVNSSVTSTLARVKKFRSKEWILAHQVLNKDGEWEIDPNDKEIAEIAKKTMEYIEEEEKGNLVFEDQEDALTKAMGKKDHRGRVKAMGGNVCHTVAFGPRKRQNKFSHSEASSDVIESIRASMRKEFEDDLDKIVEKRVQEALQKQLAAMGHMGQYASTSNPVDDLHGHAEHDSSPQPRELKERVPCHLALEDEVSGNKVIVADGMVQPSDGALTQHFRLMKPDHYKVQIDFVYEGHVDDILPVPIGDGLTNLGGAQGSFVQWPIHLVIFEDDEEFTPSLIKKSKSKSLQSKSNKEVVGSCDRKTQESAAKSKKANFANDAIQGLGPQCKYLHFFISSAPGEIYDSTPIKLDASIWHYSQDQDTYVTESDVEEFLRGACLNISVIQVYILYLLHDHIWAFERSSQIGFLCPETMSSTRIKVDPIVPTEYLKKIFVAEIQKEKMNDPSITKWFLLPYNQEPT